MKFKTSLLRVSMALALGLLIAAAMAADYPDKPIRLIVPTTVGSTPGGRARCIGADQPAGSDRNHRAQRGRQDCAGRLHAGHSDHVAYHRAQFAGQTAL